MRRKLIAGNWKMNGLTADGLKLAESLAQRAQQAADYGDPKPPACDLLVCPPFTLLWPVRDAIVGGGIALGGQDCHAVQSGAHTGDVSAAMLRDLGCDFVILGHSERRQNHGEDDATVRAKAEAALDSGLTPIVCVGETEAERDAGETLAVIARQIERALPISALAQEETGLVIAYEPVWAIGTGRTATPDQVQEVHAALRRHLADLLGAGRADATRLLYGGSVKPENAQELMVLADVDGALVGGASLKTEDFWAIATACPL
ncbi:triose-phosphate isomerase [Algihabitans albus]|uniref:triose-phosphate isomerase n=1 Tax=Algihabitans albus TaxID=2164067 RepID=UPI000E5C9242|nr:triose-phosphate isomerase [Algihabitans albus]